MGTETRVVSRPGTKCTDGLANSVKIAMKYFRKSRWRVEQRSTVDPVKEPQSRDRFLFPLARVGNLRGENLRPCFYSSYI